MALEFDQKKLEEVIKAQLIISQQEEIINENIGDIASDFGVNKTIARKIIKAFAQDKLEKTQEKLEDERSALANAEVLLEVVENISVETPELENEENK